MPALTRPDPEHTIGTPAFRRRLGRLLCMALLSLGAGIAAGQGFPSRPVIVVVPYPAGGTADALARVVAPHLSRQLGQPVVVENVSGASGSLGAQRLQQAAHDGHTLMVASPSETILVPLTMAGVRYAAEDFRLLTLGMSVPTALLARAGLPHAGIRELVAQARDPAQPELSFASVGVGSIPHLAGAHFAQLSGARLLHVPYRGAAPLMQALMSGEVDLAFFPLVGQVLGMAGTGKVRILGIAGLDRGPAAAPYPLLGEEAQFKDFVHPAWSAFAVARGVPEDRVQRLSRAVADALSAPDVRAWARDTGTTPPPEGTGLAEAAAFYRAEVAKLNQLARSVKLQAN